jgi:hypothetical protein
MFMVLAVVALLALASWPRVSTLAQDASKMESLEVTLRKYHGKEIQLLGVHGEKTIVPLGTLHTENRAGHVLFITRRTDAFVIPYSSILYFRERPSSPLTPGLPGPPQLQLVTAVPL